MPNQEKCWCLMLLLQTYTLATCHGRTCFTQHALKRDKNLLSDTYSNVYTLYTITLEFTSVLQK